MTGLLAILPMLIVAVAAGAIVISLAVRRSHAWTLALTIAGLGAAAGCLPFIAGVAPAVTSAALGASGDVQMLRMDGFSRFFIGLIALESMAVALLSYGYLKRRGGPSDEYYVLLLLATLGAMVLAGATHFAMFFLGLEMLSVSLYALIAYHRRGERSVEAAFKYLILAGTAAAILLFGMALVYAELRTMEFTAIAAAADEMAHAGRPAGVILLAGLALIVAGAAFKLALVPLHLWTPDVYQGAPAPVTAFIATVSKGGILAVLLRVLGMIDLHSPAMRGVLVGVVVLAVASMLLGNFLALLQTNVKRLLAYSSISHMGYVLVALLAGGSAGPAAAAFYLLAYFVTMTGALGVVTVLSGGQRDAEDLEEYRGLAARRPALAAIMAAMMLSLAGIPLTGGFVGKFYLISAGVSAELYLPVAVLLASSTIGLYYYLRVIAVMYMPAEVGEAKAETPNSKPAPVRSAGEAKRWINSVPAWIALATSAVLLIWIGVYPTTFLDLIQTLVKF